MSSIQIKKLQGVFTAIATPFNKDRSIDFQSLADLIEFNLRNSISGIVPCGTTGESSTLSCKEHNEVIKFTIAYVNKRAIVIAGTGSNSTEEAKKLTRHALESGADYTLQVTPYYNKPSQEGLYRHFMEIADIGLPVIVYNIESRTGRNIETSTLMRIAEHENVVGVKEASGDISQIMEVIRQRPEGFSVLSGDDKLAYPIIALGGDGLISVASNAIPGEMSEMVGSALKGDYAKARDMHYRLLPFFKSLFIDTNPQPIKYMLSLQDRCKEVYRPPMCEISDGNKEIVRAAMKDMGLLK